jgi:hypothetical protein
MVEEGSWIEPAELARLVERDVRISGDEAPAEAIMQEQNVPISLSGPSVRPLDLPTYRIRRDRWEAGEGPRLTGMRQFMDALESLAEPARVATVRGRRTNYVFLIDADVTRVLASVAVDAPE